MRFVFASCLGTLTFNDISNKGDLSLLKLQDLDNDVNVKAIMITTIVFITVEEKDAISS